MEQSDFRSILKRYLQGHASAEEERIIDSWYEAMGKGHHSLLNRDEESALEKRYWTTVAAHIKSTQKIVPLNSLRHLRRRTAVWYTIGIAASMLVFIASYLYVINYRESRKDMLAVSEEGVSQTWTHLTNTNDVAQRFNLPDGSNIVLEPQSRLRYSSSFNKSKREIYLEGAALFEVYRNEQRPFFVYANEVTTMVLGTSFSVKAFNKDKNITVAVSTGRVSVYTNLEYKAENAKESGIILTPNQQIIYNRNEKTILRRLVEVPQAIIPAEKVKRMRFEEAPVKEIFEAIEKVYGVDIVFDEERFSNCALTTSISDGGIYNRLDIICKAIGAAYTLNENRIVITGTGCN